jgi:hypothetical protein
MKAFKTHFYLKETFMAKKDRIDDQPFTCHNDRFQTDTEKGKPHGKAQAGGSVFPGPLVPGDYYTLWLEFVRDKKGGPDTLWLMWYDGEGTPTIPMSGVISADQIKQMTAKLTDFIKLV